jgi:hypothetical protein
MGIMIAAAAAAPTKILTCEDPAGRGRRPDWAAKAQAVCSWLRWYSGSPGEMAGVREYFKENSGMIA